MVSYELQAGSGSDYAEDQMYIYQYPNTWEEDQEVQNAMLDALKNYCEQLYNASAIDSYRIYWTDTHPDIYATDKDEFLNDWENWLESRDPPIGAHLNVNNSIWNGKANLGDHGWTAFNSHWRACVMGVEAAEEYWQQGGIQETMHNYLDYTKFPSTFSNDHDSGHEHHDLGKLWCSGYNEASPMCTGYEGTHANHGKCDDSCSHDDVYHQDLTYCAKEAINETANSY